MDPLEENHVRVKIQQSLLYGTKWGARIEDIDKAFLTVDEKRFADATPIIDLSGVGYIGHDCLIYLIALIASLTDSKRSPLLELPESEKAIHYLEAWNFMPTIADVAGRPEEELLTVGSADRLSAVRAADPRYLTQQTEPDGGTASLLPVHSLSIQPIEIDRGSKHAASSIKNKWLSKDLMRILDRWLGPRSSRVATHVLYEAVLNSASHPKASRALISSHFTTMVGSNTTNGPYLEIALWDDGANFEHTLNEARAQFGSTRTAQFGTVDERIELHVYRSDGIEKMAVSSRDESEPEEVITTIASAFLAFVSSQPYGQRELDAQPLDHDIQEVLGSTRGAGLYLVRRNVINVFQGTIQYVSSNYRMTLSGGRLGSTYTAQVGHDARFPHIKGNLLLFRLPLRAGGIVDK